MARVLAMLVADPSVVPLEGDAALLLHGDTLCTDDLDYQAWRTVSRVTQRLRVGRPVTQTNRAHATWSVPSPVKL